MQSEAFPRNIKPQSGIYLMEDNENSSTIFQTSDEFNVPATDGRVISWATREKSAAAISFTAWPNVNILNEPYVGEYRNKSSVVERS